MKYLVASLLALPLLVSCVDDGYGHHDYYAAPPPRAEVHRHYPNDHYHPQQRYYNQAPRGYRGHLPVAQAYVQQHGRPPVAQVQVQQHGRPPAAQVQVQQPGRPPAAQVQVQQPSRPPAAQAQVQQHEHVAPNAAPVAQQPNSSPPAAAPVAVHEQTNEPQKATPPRPAEVQEEGQGTVHRH